MIVPIYKPIGPTTHQLAISYAKKTGEKVTHTGSLDPMAEGVVVLLTDDNRFEKGRGEIKKWRKTYEFEILFGVSTDSHDLLGLQTDMLDTKIDTRELTKVIDATLPNFTGKTRQILPRFSAQRIDGKSYFDYAREKMPFEPKGVDIEIYSLKRTSYIYKIPLDAAFRIIAKRIQLVQGNFRQTEIISNWDGTIHHLVTNGVNSLPIVKFVAETSSRTYIRGLTRDLSQRIGIPATTFSIIRSQNGPYKTSDCLI